MQKNFGHDDLAAERTILAAIRTFSAWIRTGLAGVASGFAFARVVTLKSYEDKFFARLIGALLVIWGACIFVYAIIDYRRTCKRLKQEGPSKNSFRALVLITSMLLIVAAIVFWLTVK